MLTRASFDSAPDYLNPLIPSSPSKHNVRFMTIGRRFHHFASHDNYGARHRISAKGFVNEKTGNKTHAECKAKSITKPSNTIASIASSHCHESSLMCFTDITIVELLWMSATQSGAWHQNHKHPHITAWLQVPQVSLVVTGQPHHETSLAI